MEHYSGEDAAFRRSVREFLESVPALSDDAASEEFLRHCLCELRAARKAGVLALGNPSADQCAREAAFAVYGDPTSRLDAVRLAAEAVADELSEAAYPHLCRFLRMRPSAGPPLPVAAVGYFFRQQVASDERLARELTFAGLERIRELSDAGFAALSQASPSDRTKNG